MKAVIFALWAGSIVLLWAQHGPKERIEAIKIAYLTRKLSLTPEEAQAFWPIYDRYSKEKQQLWRQWQKARMNFWEKDNPTNKDYEQLIQEGFRYREALLELDKKYYEEFKKVLPLEKIARFYKAEQEFKQFLIKHLSRQGRGGPHAQRFHRW